MTRETVKLPVQKVEGAGEIHLPRYMTEGASGMDLHAANKEPIKMAPGEIVLVPTGLMVAVPFGFELQIRPRSGLAAKQGIGILNSPGTIDSDYRGEIKVIMINLGSGPVVINRNDRIAQMVLCQVPRAVLTETDQLPPTGRSDGGFGHTG